MREIHFYDMVAGNNYYTNTGRKLTLLSVDCNSTKYPKYRFRFENGKEMEYFCVGETTLFEDYRFGE
jgi:hypothetical protein